MYYNFTPLVESTLLEHSVTVFCGAQKNNFPHLLCSFGLANNPMKRRKCPEFIADEHLAVPGDTRPEDALGTWVFLATLDKGEGGPGLEFQRESRQYTDKQKEQTYGKQILAGPPRNTWTQKEVQQTGFARFLGVRHI